VERISTIAAKAIGIVLPFAFIHFKKYEYEIELSRLASCISRHEWQEG